VGGAGKENHPEEKEMATYSYKVGSVANGKFNLTTRTGGAESFAPLSINAETDVNGVRMRLGDNATNWHNKVADATVSFQTTSASSAANVLQVSDGSHGLLAKKTATYTIDTGVTVTGIALIREGAALVGTPSNHFNYGNFDYLKHTIAVGASDERMKANVTSADLDVCLDNIGNLQLRTYVTREGRTVHGLVAQEVQTVIPEAVYVSPGSLPNGTEVADYHSLCYERIFSILVGAVQKLSVKAETLQSHLDTL
jgi:hypothetical protein